MKITSHLTIITMGAALMTSATAATIAAYDGGADTTNYYSGNASYVASGGVSGGYAQLTASATTLQGYNTFDRSDVGTYTTSTFSFQFRVDQTGGLQAADGFSFSYLPTATYGATGNPGANPFTYAETPNAANMLGFGFNTYNADTISVNWNNAQVASMPTINLEDGAWHTVTGIVNFGTAQVSLALDGNNVFTNQSVAGLTPYESRITLGARTGAGWERHSIDNLNVQFIPEPSAALLGGLGALALLRRRRGA